MSTNPPRRRAPNADWHAVAAHARRFPGEWIDLPPTYPAINLTLLRRGEHYAAFAPLAFEVQGWTRGAQRVRYIGDPREPLATHERFVLNYADESTTRHVVEPAEVAFAHGLDRAGYTLLALHPRAIEEPAHADLPIPSGATDEAAER